MSAKFKLALLVIGMNVLSVHGRTFCTLSQAKDILYGDPIKTNVYISAVALTSVNSVSSGQSPLIIQDATGRLSVIHLHDLPNVVRGDRFEAEIYICSRPGSDPWAHLLRLKPIGTEATPDPQDISLSALDSAENDLLSVRITGTIVSILPDEIDANYVVALLKDGSSFLPLLTQKEYPLPAVGSTVRLTGIYHRAVSGVRKFSGPYIEHLPENPIEVVRPAPEDPFSAPPLTQKHHLSPREIAGMGPRTVSGIVLASWGEGQTMIKTVDGRIVNITLERGVKLPMPDETGIFVGYPSTDLFRINLTRAKFRQQGIPIALTDEPEVTSADKIITQQWLKRSELSPYHGQLLRMRGIVRILPLEQSAEQRIILDCGEHKVPIDISRCHEVAQRVPIGSEIEVTGRCYLDIDSWRPDNIFPHIRGFTLITRTANDIRVTKYPPWWTPTRLMMVIGVILAALLGSFVWVFTLHRLAERRGHALYRARQAQDAERRTREIAELRMQDRTRLAVELHDTISQNLTGATMQMGTAAQLVEADHVQAIRHLDIATRTLDACREELRNCIWDLRNNALDVPDLNDAIRMTLQRLMGGVMLQIRFNIPREKLSDNTVHALMRIVRELTTNAVRHGAAKTIRIAGALDNGILSFSVTDNGKGFDPENGSGLAEGHFGLQGVEERVEELGGEMKISSKIGKGTRVKIWIKSEC